MSRPTKNKRRTLKLRAKFAAERKQYTTYQWCKAELRRMRSEGLYDGDPEDWHPAARLTRLAEDPTSPKSIAAFCHKILLEYVEVSMVDQLRLDANNNPADLQVTVVVQPWAAGKPSAPALPARDETIIEPDAPHNNSTPPTPRLSDRDRLRAAARAAKETVVLEVPVSPAEPRREIARVSQMRGVVDVRDEERRRAAQMAQHHEDLSDTNVSSNVPLFGR